MATNLFSKAAAYRRKHPHLTQAEAVQAVAKANRAGKKAAPKKRAAVKKRAAPKKRAVAKKRAAPKKRAAVGKVRRPAKPKAATPRKIKVKIKPGKKGTSSISISGVSMSKISQELGHQNSLNNSLEKHKAQLKQKGLTASEKTRIRREILHYKNAIAASKKHITALKRSI